MSQNNVLSDFVSDETIHRTQVRPPPSAPSGDYLQFKRRPFAPTAVQHDQAVFEQYNQVSETTSPFKQSQSNRFKRISPRQQLLNSGQMPLNKPGTETFRSSVNIPNSKLGQQRTRILIQSYDDNDASTVVHRRVDNFLNEFGNPSAGIFDRESEQNPYNGDSVNHSIENSSFVKVYPKHHQIMNAMARGQDNYKDQDQD